jgi:hypothetical protein
MIIDKTALKVESTDSGVNFIAADNRTAFSIRIINGHTLEISGGTCTKDQDKIYSEGLTIHPMDCTRIQIEKTPYED